MNQDLRLGQPSCSMRNSRSSSPAMLKDFYVQALFMGLLTAFVGSASS
ncbi:benzoate transporter, partial [Rhizobium johnstonii]